MKHSSTIRYGILGATATAAAAAAVGMYFANPFHTPSRDWRARVLGFTLYRAPSASMERTVKRGSIFLVNVATLRARDPRPGEIVVFQYPPNPEAAYFKRVVAVGGSVVELRDNHLYVDDKLIDEPYLDADLLATDQYRDMPPYEVPAGHFFVLGDNRGNSADSRVWGTVPRELMIGTYVSFTGD